MRTRRVRWIAVALALLSFSACAKYADDEAKDYSLGVAYTGTPPVEPGGGNLDDGDGSGGSTSNPPTPPPDDPPSQTERPVGTRWTPTCPTFDPGKVYLIGDSAFGDSIVDPSAPESMCPGFSYSFTLFGGTWIRPTDGRLLYLSHNRIVKFSPAPLVWEGDRWAINSEDNEEIVLDHGPCTVDSSPGIGFFLVGPEGNIAYQCNHGQLQEWYDQTGGLVKPEGIRLIHLGYTGLKLGQVGPQADLSIINHDGTAMSVTAGGTDNWPEVPSILAVRSLPNGFKIVTHDEQGHHLWQVDATGHAFLVGDYAVPPPTADPDWSIDGQLQSNDDFLRFSIKPGGGSDLIVIQRLEPQTSEVVYDDSNAERFPDNRLSLPPRSYTIIGSTDSMLVSGP